MPTIYYQQFQMVQLNRFCLSSFPWDEAGHAGTSKAIDFSWGKMQYIPMESPRWNLNFLNTDCFVKFLSQVFMTHDKKRLSEKITETTGHYCLQILLFLQGNWIKTAKSLTSNIATVPTSNNKDIWKSFIFLFQLLDRLFCFFNKS